MPLSPLGLGAKLNMAGVTNEGHKLAAGLEARWTQILELNAWKYSLFIINFGINIHSYSINMTFEIIYWNN